MNNYIELTLKIDALKEYIDTELCRKCEQMQSQLDSLLKELEEIREKDKA